MPVSETDKEVPFLVSSWRPVEIAICSDPSTRIENIFAGVQRASVRLTSMTYGMARLGSWVNTHPAPMPLRRAAQGLFLASRLPTRRPD